MHQTSKSCENTDLTNVIVNHNTQQLLLQFLQSVYDIIEGLNIEIFVVDNASSDDSQEMVRSRFPQVHLISNSKDLGFTQALNMALPEGKSDYFLPAHTDIKFLPGAIYEMLSLVASHPQTGVVGGNLLSPDGTYNI